MLEPKMKCWGEYPDWQLEWNMQWISIVNKPEICETCEFFQFCFMNRTSEILGMPMNLSLEAMIQLVYLQRLQDDTNSDEAILWAYIESLCAVKQ